MKTNMKVNIENLIDKSPRELNILKKEYLDNMDFVSACEVKSFARHCTKIKMLVKRGGQEQ
ncbi:hypothetical protein Phi40:1_gp076 [Cellulophaga phage phi40:1]|uniref:Uncharacterized protein n=1 Tax=Cellulophaga phage phi38:1 TaxID=1327977 RepID=R9ZYB0_9CAUD|nr:hypothetical protein Phi38:1_gp076 [Cellulophaga phage phi38:1]AGO47941.1 hypothetical protein Phi40:1_gp076 [Cellulophaga phage phi40:1]AGO48106.1 hypothetical protein Phi38:1_gp076 [Cellulophaga phage phi38:1]